MNRKDGRFSYEDVFQNDEKTCSRESELLEYFEKVLTEKSKPDFEKHLASCSICADHLAALEETTAAAEMTSIDAVKADPIFQTTRNKLENHLQIKYGTPKKIQSRSHLFGNFRIPSYAGALMGGLLLVLIYPAYKGFVLDSEVNRLQRELEVERSLENNDPGTLTKLQREYEEKIQSLSRERDLLKQPSASLSEIHSVRAERTESNGKIEVTYDSTDQIQNLTFSVQGGYDTYSIELLQDGALIWNDDVKAKSGDSQFALISVNLPAAYFKNGQYNLRISAEKQTLGEFRLKIAGL